MRSLLNKQGNLSETLFGRIVRLGAFLDRVARSIETLAMILSASAIALTTIIVCAEVVLRTTMGISTLISAEYAGYLLAVTVYFGLAWTFRNGGFIRVELVHSLLAGRVAAILNFFIAGIATATLIVYTYYIFTFVIATEISGATSVFITRTPLWIPQAAMPIGCVLLTWAMASFMVRSAAAAIRPDLFSKPEQIDEEGFL